MHAHAHTHAYTHAHTHIYTHTRTHTHTYKHTHTHSYTYTHTHTQTHTHTHTHTYTHMHTHAHTHPPTHPPTHTHTNPRSYTFANTGTNLETRRKHAPKSCCIGAEYIEKYLHTHTHTHAHTHKPTLIYICYCVSAPLHMIYIYTNGGARTSHPHISNPDALVPSISRRLITLFANIQFSKQTTPEFFGPQIDDYSAFKKPRCGRLDSGAWRDLEFWTRGRRLAFSQTWSNLLPRLPSSTLTRACLQVCLWQQQTSE